MYIKNYENMLFDDLKHGGMNSYSYSITRKILEKVEEEIQKIKQENNKHNKR